MSDEQSQPIQPQSDLTRRASVASPADNNRSDRDAFRALMGNLPTDYQGARERLRELSDRFHDELAAAFQPVLRAELTKFPTATIEEKRALAIWANGELRHLGLAFRSPSGDPARLIVDWAKGHETEGRFRFVMGNHKGRNIREGNFHELPPIDLIEEGPRKEFLSKWTDRVATDDETRQR